MKVFVRKGETVDLYACPGCAATLAVMEPGEIPKDHPETCVHCGEDLDWTEVEKEAKA